MIVALKDYPKNTLAAVKAYFQRCAFEPPEAAYRTVTAEGNTDVYRGS